jgi:crotonobetainyl-CoA:carnitine CoA-transferase CaiB-like acyl-CoA transferase
MVKSSDGGGRRASGPLSGLRVIDMTTSYAGPTASMYLADLGADVIKVERPDAGDDARSWGPPFVDGVSAWFASANRNKRSIVVNTRSAAGVTILHDLISGADVFMESILPSKLARLGLDPAGLCARYPRLIYCAMSGFGLDGPASHLPGYDLAAQARSGLMSVTGAKGGPPQRVSTALSDVVTGISAALAICAAAVRQQVGGQGDLIDVSLLDSDLALMAPRIAAYLADESEPCPSGGTDSVLAVYQPFPTANRQIVVAIGNDAMWERFCAALDLEELAADPALRTNAGRRRQREHITSRITDRLAERTAQEWVKALAEADVPCSVVQSLSEVVTDPQVEARDSLLPIPGFEGLHTVRSPFRLRSVPGPRNAPFPALGEHTLEILTELGLKEQEIAEHFRTGAVQLAREGHDGAARND